MIYLGCPCGCPHKTGQRFYVTAVNGDQVAFLAGPFLRHERALELVDRASREAQDVDPWAAFYAFGTAALPRSKSKKVVGILNDKLGLVRT